MKGEHPKSAVTVDDIVADPKKLTATSLTPARDGRLSLNRTDFLRD